MQQPRKLFEEAEGAEPEPGAQADCSWKWVLRYLTLAVVLTTCSFQSTYAQTRDDDRKFLDDTRNSYSVLRRQGLIELRASVLPNWNIILKEAKPSNKTAAVKLASRLRFSVVANTNGRIEVSHVIVGPKPNKGTADALDNMAKGVELSVTGFLMSWAPFMLTYLIPENLDHFVLQDVDSGRLLTFQQSGIDISVAITRDFEIKELRTSQGGVKPILTRSKDGFVLTGYEANNEDPVAGRVDLKARIDLAETQGMLLPKTVFLNGSASATPINFELHFTNYRLRKKV